MKVLNFYYMWLMLSPNMHELNLWKINKEKAFFHGFTEIVD